MEDEILKECLKRLAAIGYDADEENDLLLLEKIKESCDEYIRSFCGREDIPEGLAFARADMICGEFLLNRKNCGSLKLEGLKLEAAVKSIQEGDISIEYAEESSDAGQQLDRLIDRLIYRLGKELINYRCVKWN